MGGTNRSRLRKARQLAPSHCFGVTWTPADRRLNEIPFFVDNGAFTSSFDPDEWVGLLDKLEDYNYGPDFVVLPDEYNDAEGTMARHREWAPEVLDRGLPPAAVIQPGMPVETQVGLADKIGADFVFSRRRDALETSARLRDRRRSPRARHGCSHWPAGRRGRAAVGLRDRRRQRGHVVD